MFWLFCHGGTTLAEFFIFIKMLSYVSFIRMVNTKVLTVTISKFPKKYTLWEHNHERIRNQKVQCALVECLVSNLQVPWFFLGFFPNVDLACASLKNYKKKTMEISPGSSKDDAKNCAIDFSKCLGSLKWNYYTIP